MRNRLVGVLVNTDDRSRLAWLAETWENQQHANALRIIVSDDIQAVRVPPAGVTRQSMSGLPLATTLSQSGIGGRDVRRSMTTRQRSIGGDSRTFAGTAAAISTIGVS